MFLCSAARVRVPARFLNLRFWTLLPPSVIYSDARMTVVVIVSSLSYWPKKRVKLKSRPER